MVNNKIKACVVFLGMLYVLYGGKLVNVWRSGSRIGYAPGQERIWSMEETLGRGHGGGQEVGGGYGRTFN